MRLDALEVEMETEETIEDNIISRQFKITNTKNVGDISWNYWHLNFHLIDLN